MPFGGQTVTFVSIGETGVSDALGNKALTEAVTNAPNCRHRPLTFAETAELEFDIATEFWRSTVPVGEYAASLRSTVMAAKPGDVIRVDGEEYQIIGGIRTHPDMDGVPFKATIISKKHIG